MPDDEVTPTVERLHHHLAATRERPVERDASRWIGEAEAVAADLVGDDAPAEVLVERLRHVESLLEHVDDTEDAEADAHLQEAKRITAALLDGHGVVD